MAVFESIIVSTPAQDNGDDAGGATSLRSLEQSSGVGTCEYRACGDGDIEPTLKSTKISSLTDVSIRQQKIIVRKSSDYDHSLCFSLALALIFFSALFITVGLLLGALTSQSLPSVYLVATGLVLLATFITASIASALYKKLPTPAGGARRTKRT